MNSADTMLSEISQSQKGKCNSIPWRRDPWSSQIHRDGRVTVTRDEKKGGNEGEVSCWEDEKQ